MRTEEGESIDINIWKLEEDIVFVPDIVEFES